MVRDDERCWSGAGGGCRNDNSCNPAVSRICTCDAAICERFRSKGEGTYNMYIYVYIYYKVGCQKSNVSRVLCSCTVKRDHTMNVLYSYKYYNTNTRVDTNLFIPKVYWCDSEFLTMVRDCTSGAQGFLVLAFLGAVILAGCWSCVCAFWMAAVVVIFILSHHGLTIFSLVD
jgi:hypothetical protein